MRRMTLPEVLYLHYRITKAIGGRHGVRAPALLESAVNRPYRTINGREVFPSPFEKAAVLLVGILGSKPFTDNNEQTALAAALLLLNQYRLRPPPPEEVVALVKEVMVGERDWRVVARWFSERAAGKGEVPEAP